jgi:putative phosphoribosyl transferase
MPLPPSFEDRHDAGRRLAERLARYRDEHPIVLALPRGGVVLGYEVARALDAPLDVVVARKVGTPGHPELGIGAVAPGVTLADARALAALGLTREAFETLAAHARAEMSRRLQRYHGSDALPDVAGRTVIVVDDGLATGVTAAAALHAVRRGNPRRVVLAAGVCARETVEALRGLADDVVCAAIPEPLYAVGQHYRDFAQTTDEEVLAFLARAREEEQKRRKRLPAPTTPLPAPTAPPAAPSAAAVRVRAGRVALDGDLVVPEGARGIVLVAHGSGSSR